MRIDAFVALLVAAVAVGAPAAAQVPERPRVQTAASDGTAKTTFDPGEALLVRGGRFPPGARVVLTFEQQAAADIGAAEIDGGGAFAVTARVPLAAVTGPATLRASSDETTSSASVAVRAPLPDAPDEGLIALLPWAVALLLTSEALAWSVWRPTRRRGEAVRRHRSHRGDEGAEGEEPHATEQASAAVRRLLDDIAFWTRKR